MKKVLGLATAGLLAISTAQAGTITVANSDLTLYGAVSAGFETQDNDLVDDKYPTRTGVQAPSSDTFRLYNVIIGLKKEANPNSPIGFNVAFGQFEVPTVLASTEVVNDADFNNDGNADNLVQLGKTNDGFKPWLATVDIVPIDGLKLSGGILWSKYGERPVTFLNPHISRGLMFVYFNPVVYTGARVEYSLNLPGLGDVGIYAGYNQANGLFQGNDPLNLREGYYANGTRKPNADDPSDAYELGITGSLNLGAKIKYGLHYYDEAGGRNIWTLCLNSDFGLVKGGFQDRIKDDRANNVYDDSFWGIGINFNISLLDAAIANVEIPMRLEYVKLDHDGTDNDTDNDKIWSFTITPTWKPTKNTFLRAEYTYTKADSKTFYDVDPASNATDDTRNTYAIEAGFLF
ncbi:MAG: porin [Persephonella sp.]|nr:MAG: porin [Persephonella sp.]